MSTVASQSINFRPSLKITYVSLVLYTLEPPKLIKDHYKIKVLVLYLEVVLY